MQSRLFAKRILDWADQHGRHNLPWQKAPDRYRVWISEIMLQQTQVKTVIPYYERFMRSFPDVSTLAASPEDQVLEHWSGLGYYARARNLHKTAGIVTREHAGELPKTLEELMALPGIGRSTAGAILSLADNQATAILDGNVKRVLARYAGIDGYPGKTAVLKELWTLAESLTPDKHTGRYNQAMMDMGATLCTRSRPKCHECPLASACVAFDQGKPENYPGKKPRKVLPVKTVAMMILRNSDGHVLLEQRPPSGIWGGLWSLPEFPSVHSEKEPGDTKQINAEKPPVDSQPKPPKEDLTAWLAARGFNARNKAKGEEVAAFRHTFSHYHLEISVVELPVTEIDVAIMEPAHTVWYKGGKWPGGMAAPMSKLDRVLRGDRLNKPDKAGRNQQTKLNKRSTKNQSGELL